MKKIKFRCRHCGKRTNFEIELMEGRLNYNFYCRHCKQKNIGTIVEKVGKNTGKISKNSV